MSRLGFALAMLAVVAVAAWAYHVNYETKTALARVDRLHERIAAEREAVEVLRVEWAYLNAPDRLARLVAVNNARLDLVPMGPHHFDEVAAIPFPPRPQPQVPVEADGPGPVDAPEPHEPPLVISGRTPPVLAAMPQPRPASWRRQ